MPKRVLLLLIASIFALSSCHPTRVFYQPNKVLYADPEKMDLEFQMTWFPSQDGKKLFALYFPTDQEPKGMVVHFHGNFGNVSNHFPVLQWITKYGYDYFIFDYQGFGGSEGKPRPRTTIRDGLAAIKFARKIARDPEQDILVVGQSLGGAIAAVVSAMDKNVKAVVLESAFTSYRGIARAVLGRSWLLWIAYPIYPLLLPTKWDPIRYVHQIAPRPVLFIHGTEDRVIPVKMSKALQNKAQEPKELWLIEGAGHLQCWKKEQENYEEKVAGFFDGALGIKR